MERLQLTDKCKQDIEKNVNLMIEDACLMRLLEKDGIDFNKVVKDITALMTDFIETGRVRKMHAPEIRVALENYFDGNTDVPPSHWDDTNFRGIIMLFNKAIRKSVEANMTVLAQA